MIIVLLGESNLISSIFTNDLSLATKDWERRAVKKSSQVKSSQQAIMDILCKICGIYFYISSLSKVNAYYYSTNYRSNRGKNRREVSQKEVSKRNSKYVYFAACPAVVIIKFLQLTLIFNTRVSKVNQCKFKKKGSLFFFFIWRLVI